MKYLKEFSDKILLPETITVPRKDLAIALSYLGNFLHQVRTSWLRRPKTRSKSEKKAALL